MKPGTLIDSRYRVDRELGSGGMGFVVACTDLKLPRTVALKMLHGQALTDPVQLARFEREARAAAKLKSEHVVRTLDVGRLPNDAPYIVMELLDGQDLQDLVKSGPLPYATAIDYVLQACAALAEAHANGIVHRDLKPQNLFLANRPGRAPIVKVLDFGISKLETDDGVNLTRTRDLMGTPLYMAPEQLQSAKHVDARTDVWALGAILYCLVAGHPPFDGETVATLFASILGSEPPSLRELRGDVPDSIVHATSRALVKNPSARLPNVVELARILDPRDQGPIVEQPALARTLPMALAMPVSEPPRPRRSLLPLALVPVVAIGALALWPRPKLPVAPPETSASAAPVASDEAPVAVNLLQDAPLSSSTAIAPRKAGHRAPSSRPGRAATTNSAAPAQPHAPEQDDSLPDMRK